MTRHNTLADKELPEGLPQELWATECIWVRTRRPRATPTPSFSAASATPSSRWATGRTTSPPPGSSPAPVVPPSRLGGGNHPPIKRICFNLTPSPLPAEADPGTIFPSHACQVFLHPQWKHLQAAIRNATAGSLPGNGAKTVRRTPLFNIYLINVLCSWFFAPLCTGFDFLSV